MKSIELTEEHKSKLLEMCKELFPEYKFISFKDESHLGAYEFEFNNICLSKKSLDLFDIELNVHWFEFCMTHLARKIGNSSRLFDNPVEDAGDMLADMVFKQEWFNKYHPVNYLYEQFKRLK